MSAAKITKQGSILTVRPESRLDAVTSPALEQDLQAIPEDVREIVLDLEDTAYVSSAGIRVLLAASQRIGQLGGSFRLIHVSENIRDIFSLVGLDALVPVEEE